MRLLTSVLKDPQIQNYISEQEDSAFEYLKSNFSVNDIYEHIVNNISFYINEDDIEGSYENIKTAASSYTIRVLNENLFQSFYSFTRIANEHRTQVNEVIQNYINKGLGATYSKLLDFGFNDKEAKLLVDAADSLKQSDLSKDDCGEFLLQLFNGNYKIAKEVLHSRNAFSSPEAEKLLSKLEQNYLLDKAERFFNRIGRNDLSKNIEDIKDFILQYPQYAIPAIVLGIIGCIIGFFGLKNLLRVKK